MANEFKHKDPGGELTQAEFIASDGTGHIFDSQAAGDILYASSTTALARLAKGSDGTVLELASGVPAWTASPTIGSTSWANANHAHAASNSGGTLTALGTVATGVWQGTAIASTYIAADAITGAKIADDAIDSEHYTDGSIDAAHLAADAVTGAKIADDAIDSEHYTDGSIDNAHLADDAVDSDELAAGAVDTAHIGDNQVTAAKIFDLARGSVIVGNASAATAELTIGSNTYVLTSDGTDIAWAATGGVALTGTTANALVTITGADALTEEAALTYDGANAFALIRDTAGNADLEFLVSNTDTDATAADAVVRVNVGGTGGGDPMMAFRISGGGEWEMGNDNGSSDIFVIGQGSGALGGNDALRITHVTPPIVSLNAAHGTTFDYVCEKCGKSSYERFECCGAVYWQDDILSIRSAVVDLMAMKNPYEAGMSLNVDYMVKIGVLEYDTSEDDAMHNRKTPWLGLNLVQAQYFTWAGMFQNRERMDAQYAELKAENNELRALVGALDAR